MVCMAPSTTNSIVDSLIDGYDVEVLKWARDLGEVCNLLLNNTLI